MGAGGGGGGIKSFIYRSCVGEGGERGGGEIESFIYRSCVGGGKGGEIMMGSSVDRMRGVEWVNFANQMDYSEIDETGRDFPRSEFIRKVESPMFH